MGRRTVVSVDGTVKIRTRRGRGVTASLPELAPLADPLAARSAILDGELVTCTAGAVDFYRLAGRMAATGRTARRAAAAAPVSFVIFDLLHLDGVDLTRQPLLHRKQALDLLDLVGPAWVVNRWYPGDGGELFAACVELGHEGVVAKRLDSLYRPGVRTPTWLKAKCPDWLKYDAPKRRPVASLQGG
jgi:bifunctional non-homologous end joining protein LigD